jgi:hypothetical protein
MRPFLALGGVPDRREGVAFEGRDDPAGGEGRPTDWLDPVTPGAQPARQRQASLSGLLLDAAQGAGQRFPLLGVGLVQADADRVAPGVAAQDMSRDAHSAAATGRR